MKTDKLSLRFPLVVEGKYDKIKLSGIVSSPVITLGGFSVFNSPEKIAEIKAFAPAGTFLLLTDSDKAGNFIRGRLKTIFFGYDIINLYAPVQRGRDPRRNHAGKEGILGIESLEEKVLYTLLKPFENERRGGSYMNRQRAFADGLCGKKDSKAARKALMEALLLPPTLSAAALIEYLNNCVPEQKYTALISKENNKS